MSAPRYHWLVAGNVITNHPKKGGRQRALNVLVRTDDPFFSRENLAQAQNEMMRRFLSETDPDKDEKIVDCFMISISHLGLQTQEQFEGIFSSPTGEETQEVRSDA